MLAAVALLAFMAEGAIGDRSAIYVRMDLGASPATALLLAIAPFAPWLGPLGGALAAGTLAITSTFLITGPAWEASLGGFPALSPAGGSLIKDLALLGIALAVTGRMLTRARRAKAEPSGMRPGYGNHENTAFQSLRPLRQDLPPAGRSRSMPRQMQVDRYGLHVAIQPLTDEARPPVRRSRKPDMLADRVTPLQSFGVRPESAISAGVKAESIGLHVARYSLVLVLVWIGAMKFTAYEAGAIQPLVANSPLMSWLYAILSVQATSNLIGVAEIAAGVLIALRPVSPSAAAVGSLMAVATFLITLTFMVSTPGWEPSLGGFPALSVAPGQFILKDAVLLGAAMWSFGEALRHVASE